MATEVTLTARTRTADELGSASSRRLRRDGWVPATVYGRGKDPENVAVPAHDLRQALTTGAGRNVLLTLDLEDGADHLTLARQVQVDPIRDDIIHLDFILISRTETVAAEVPINLVGDARGVTEEGGLLDQALYALSVEALPANVPSSLDVDVTDLGLDSPLTVADIVAPEGVEVVTDAETIVASVFILAEEEEEEVEGEEVEGEEGEEAEGEDAAAADESESDDD